MFKIRIYLGVCIFFSLILSTTSATEQILEKKEPLASKNEALSQLMEKLLREKSSLPLNLNINDDTPTAKGASPKQNARHSLELDTTRPEPVPPPVVIAEGVIVRFKSPKIQLLARNNLPPPPETIAELEAALGEKLVFERATVNEAYVFNFLAPKEGKETIDAFLQPARELPSIDWIEANQRVQMQSSSVRAQPSMAQAQSFSNDPNFGDQWNMMSESEGVIGGIDAVHAWDITHGSPDTIVAVVDTGVLPHPEFADRLLPGYDFVSKLSDANDGDGRDSDASDPGDWVNKGECNGVSPHNSSWHGTHVAGIIAASGENGYGIAGVNWKTRILPVRVLGKCGGANDDIVNGLAWAAGLPVLGAPPNPYPAQVINLSLGGYGLCPRHYQETINEILGQGALVVVAAGNDEDDVNYYFPANCQGVLTVIATDHTGEFASYTNLGFTEGGIAAPGGDISWYGRRDYGILSTVDNGATTPEGFASNAYYNWKEGTSMAAPHVSGIASLMLSVNPNLAGAELYFMLQLASKPFSTGNVCATYGFCGIGIADAYGSVAVASFFSSYRLVYEFYNVDLNHYFLTGSKEDASIVNRGGAGPGWYLTSNLFYAWSGPEEGAVPVCRFYTQGANSHFYTASSEDCTYLKSLNPANAYAPDQWTYEGIAFYAKLPVNEICPDDSVPVYRVYNNRWRENDSNHRFVTSVEDYQDMITKGWVGEGIAFCSVG